MQLKPEQRKELKKTYRRLAIFLAIIFVFDAFIAFLFYNYVPKMHPVLIGFIIIVITTVLYLLFYAVCAKLDKRKQERLQKSGKKDPFSKN